MSSTQRQRLSLLERLDRWPVICAEGYVFDLEPINRRALDIAKFVAAESGALFAGDVCNTNVYDPSDPGSHKAVRQMFEEQVGWAVDAGVDFIIGETYSYAQEALIALDVIKRAKQVAVITLAMHQADVTREGWTVGDACKRLADAGADVVGLNCIRGPATMMPLLREIRAAVKTHIAALPVPFRTTDHEPSFQSLRDPKWNGAPGSKPFPLRSIRSRAIVSRSLNSAVRRWRW